MNLSDEVVIRACRLDSNACIARKDADGVAKHWRLDFVQIAGDGSHTAGKLKILADWKYMFSKGSPLFERIPGEIKIADTGDLAWESGTWNYKNAEYRGNYAAMWRKEKGTWLTQSELYVSLN
ncbi:MAG TPA: nuclear transport factor 2 family protein [Pedobacter sp.]|nr:nuclear transport factor 2 family protein [Pedobacter sp.]